MKHFAIKISGKVQGVFFRASTKQKADELTIKGFVRNEPDGSVYCEAEGREDKLKQFADWCRSGPPFATVDQCLVSEDEVKGFTEFRITR